MRTARLAALALLLPGVARADVHETLEALHAAGQRLQSLAADVALTSTSADGTGDDATVLRGHVVLQKLPGNDARIRVTFTEKQIGKRLTRNRDDFLFQGTDLIHRDEAAKKETTTAVREPGKNFDPFAIGGPFPLPVGQPPEEVLRQFEVSEIIEKMSDGGVFAPLKLIPKSGTALAKKFSEIDVTVDRKTGLPRRITTIDAAAEDTKYTELTNVRTNDAVHDADFVLDALPADWTIVK